MTTRRQKWARLGLVAFLLGGLAASAAPSGAAETPPYPGSLPDTPSAFDVSGRGTFSDLEVHVNQTDDLTTQAVSVTWSWPGHITQAGTDGIQGQAYMENVLRIMQCWGDPVTSAPAGDAVAQANYVAADPGPAREHCVYGGSLKPSDGVTIGNQALRTATSQVTGTPTSYGQETAYPTEAGYTGPDIPFIAANGTVVPHQTKRDDNGISVYANEFYDSFSTNEAPANYTFGPDGAGGLQFQVQNSVDSRGLGCGALAAGSTTTYNRCWLAIVPQGTTDYDGSTLETRKNSGIFKQSAISSPLASTNWSNRIVVPLNFLPSTTSCASAENTYGTLGSPLVANALLSWQSKLCGTTGTVFNYAQGTDQRSRDALASGTQSMQFVSDPAPAATVTTPITYAPVTLSGVGLAFVWDKATRNTKTFVTSPGQPLPTINLDQRLVAKLLSYSYIQGNPYRLANAAEPDPAPTAYSWLTGNPQWLGADPEFLSLNPDLTQLPKGVVLLQPKPTVATVQGPLDGSDGIRRLWQWVMSNEDARAFLAGTPDPYGMHVDPYFSTDAAVNPTGFAFDTDIDGLPYADPWSGLPGNTTRTCAEQATLSMSDIWPAARDLSTVAKDVLTTNPLEKFSGGFVCPGPTVGPDNPVGWKTSRSGVVIAGSRQLMGFTDTASGSQFGVTWASLRNAHGDFVAPSTASITAAGDHLADTGVQGVQQPDLTTTDPAAYPLSLIGYAGVTTHGTPKDACAAFAELLDYASADGQTAGTAIGDLPPGYVPLSATLRRQTAVAAKTVAQCAQGSTPPADTFGNGDNGGGTGGSTDTGGGSDAGTTTNPDDTSVSTDTGPTSTTPSSAAAAPKTLSASSTTKPDPSVFAYVVPIALGIGLLALLAAPVPGLRRRRPGGPPGTP